MRDDFIGLCRSYFKRVRRFETERELADALLEESEAEQEEPRGMSDNVIALHHGPDFGCHPCPACGHDAPVVGGFNTIDYIQCYRCGYYGDHWEEDGIVFDIPVPTEDGYRRVDEDAYRKRIAEIYQQARARR